MTQKTISVLGGKGCGKSTILRMIGKSLSDQKCPTIILDPIGGNSIKDKAFVNLKVTQPLDKDTIKWLKEQWAEKKTVLINAEKLNDPDFVLWCEGFFSMKWKNGVIIVDEVHYIIPQQRGKYCLSFQSYSKKCRNDNTGLILSSQRPQSVNKETLALTDTFIIGRTMYVNDREVVVNLVKPFINREEIPAFESKIQKLPFLTFIILNYRED